MAVWVRSPTTGSFSMRASNFARPLGSRRQKTNVPPKTRATAISAYHQWMTKEDPDIMILVMSGSFACKDLKKTVKRGSTKTVNTSTVTTDIQATTAG